MASTAGKDESFIAFGRSGKGRRRVQFQKFQKTSQARIKIDGQMMTGNILLTMIEWRRYSKLKGKMNGNGPNYQRLKISKRGKRSRRREYVQRNCEVMLS